MPKLNSSRIRLRAENAEFARQIPPGARVLDAGAGTAPYRDLFAHAVYETADFERVDKAYAPSTYVCDLTAIPVADETFDFIVFNQVMEHLPSPARALVELWRVLRPGGKMLYTGPLFYEEHEQPYDFYRYTQFGLRHLFTEARFEVERLDWLEGYFGTVGYQLDGMSRALPWRPRDLGSGVAGVALAPVMAATKAVSRVASRFFHRLELSRKVTSAGYPKNYVAIVRKP